ncbi:interleukin-13 receptor subunit alpha-1 [Podarcis raffonei]|uniref:interleukin-13 receptor subunit alpha-1 n=1 Tax=Podarcis raffonei TaxID=65483 RepID=UPI0023296493|nr:interleukin-13 receptor subunit alpha-1 [Podarcis raffonei]
MEPLLAEMAALLLLLLAGAVGGGVVLDLPRPTNITYTINENNCQLNVTWAPVKIEDDCNLRYVTAITTSGEWGQKEWNVQNFRTVFIPLGKKVIFGVATSCEGQGDGDYVKITLCQNGTAGTGATKILCMWYNMKYMMCSWQRGENASPNTTYKLNYWYIDQDRGGPCTHYTKKGDDFRCTFDTNLYWPPGLSISIQGNSRDIQPVCIMNKLPEVYEFLVKPDPPLIVKPKRSNEGVILQWTEPRGLNDMCYQLEINNKLDPEIYRSRNNVTLTLKSKQYYTFRVRARTSKTNCERAHDPWSEWSEAVEVDERDFPFSLLLYILLPLCVAVLTIIFLIHLKRIKMLILPTIPEPGKFLKQMFEEHIEDLQKPPPEDPIKDEQTHLLVFIQPSCNEN